MSRILQKVTAFIVRGPAPGELLLFEHPTAGIQVPAGTVHEGESGETAVLREASEETGLTGFSLPCFLGSAPAAIPENRRGIVRKATVYSRPDLGSFDWAYVPRGATVKLLGRSANGFTQVQYEEYDREPDRHYLSYGITGWVQDEALADEVVRSFFLLGFDRVTPARWTAETDNHVFTCFWAPLAHLPPLVPPQQWWLKFLPDDPLEGLTDAERRGFSSRAERGNK